jgi:hypothetical protein
MRAKVKPKHKKAPTKRFHEIHFFPGSMLIARFPQSGWFVLSVLDILNSYDKNGEARS